MTGRAILVYWRRYRQWARQFDQSATIAIGAAAGIAGVALVSLLHIVGRVDLLWKILPWLCFVGGPIAAFDAWGAAMWRGRPPEAWARSVVIVVSTLALGVWAMRHLR